jgi:hypothetical protein
MVATTYKTPDSSARRSRGWATAPADTIFLQGDYAMPTDLARLEAALAEIPELRESYRAVILCIAASIPTTDGQAWMGYPTLSESTSLSAKTVRNIINGHTHSRTKKHHPGLVELGWINVVRGHRKQTNLYGLGLKTLELLLSGEALAKMKYTQDDYAVAKDLRNLIGQRGIGSRGYEDIDARYIAQNLAAGVCGYNGEGLQKLADLLGTTVEELFGQALALTLPDDDEFRGMPVDVARNLLHYHLDTVIGRLRQERATPRLVRSERPVSRPSFDNIASPVKKDKSHQRQPGESFQEWMERTLVAA